MTDNAEEREKVRKQMHDLKKKAELAKKEGKLDLAKMFHSGSKRAQRHLNVLKKQLPHHKKPKVHHPKPGEEAPSVETPVST
jgi:hypothetical protein